MIISLLLSLSNCKQHTNILDSEIKVSTPITYQEKPFSIKWKIEKNSITKIPSNINKQIKKICKNHNRVVLVKIKTYADDTAMGTFDCRI
tara:strand:- start:158 stop:427 length:270 start_codon:yes stop_codon:yes gene_type:complete